MARPRKHLQWKHNTVFCMLLLLIYTSLSKNDIKCCKKNAFMEDLCHRQQCTLCVPVFESNYIPSNFHSLHSSHMNAVLKQENVRLLMDFSRRTVCLNRR